MNSVRSIVAGIVAAVLAGSARADTVSFHNGQGNDGAVGAFSGEISYQSEFDNDLGDFVGILSIEITNESEPSNGGYITALAFNVPRFTDNSPGGELISTTDPDFDFLSGVDAQPFGTDYDLGVASTNGWQGGGSPTSGISVGQSATFVFRIFSDDVQSMSAMDFLTFNRSSWDDRRDWDHNLVVRMRGFNDGDSDKLQGEPIPLPAPFAIGLAGLVGVALMRRRMKNAD